MAWLDILIGFLVFVCFVVAYRTTNGCPCQAVMSREVSGEAAYHRSFNATLGVGRKDIQRQSPATPTMYFIGVFPITATIYPATNFTCTN